MPMPLPPSEVKAAAAGRDGASAGYRVFIDFDNTITCGDVLDGIIENSPSTIAGAHWRRTGRPVGLERGPA